MLALVLWAQVQVAESTYASPALRALVGEASRRNRNVPASVRAYTAAVETELAVVVRQREGIEGPVSLEQLSSTARWERPGDFEQHVTGYRVRAMGPQFASVGIFRQSFLVPHLYGNRLLLLFGPDTSRRRRRASNPQDRMVAIHPLAEDRERAYRFRGGDTVVTLKVGDRAIPVVRVFVEPRADPPERLLAFYGELDIDATRLHIVRMRGRFVTPGVRRTALGRLTAPAMEVVAYVELENAEVEQQVWLPWQQRIEGQALFRIATDARSAFRLVSRFRDYRLSGADGAAEAATDSLVVRPHRYTVAPADSLGRADAFARTLGEATSSMSVEDFDELAPERWRPSGAPLVSWSVTGVADLVHANRVEGVYTGMGVDAQLRDALPGARIQGTAGWAWSERVVRGRASLTRERARTSWGVRAGRTLDNTNDFRIGLDSGSALGTFFGVDDYDYVDRQFVAGRVQRALGVRRSTTLRLEVAAVRDGAVEQHIARSPLGFGGPLRGVRGVLPGSYVRSSVGLDVAPGVGLGLVKPGVGLRATMEVARGDLRYERAELRLAARRYGRHVVGTLKADAGMVRGRVPPQQLFELGSTQGLPGYTYKEFAGTEGVLLRALVMKPLPLWRAPIRLTRRLMLPGLSPGLAAGVHSAWTGISGSSAREAFERLSRIPASGAAGSLCTSSTTGLVSVPTCGWRTTVSAGVRLFGSALGIDLARAVDRRAPWRLVLSGGEF